MISVGCKFGPDDLSPEEWDELIVLAQERNYIDDRVSAQRDGEREKQRAADKVLNTSRQESGIPAPGGSLFPRTKPVR